MSLLDELRVAVAAHARVIVFGRLGDGNLHVNVLGLDDHADTSVDDAVLALVVRHGGTAFVIDNDASRSTFGRWFRRGFPHLPPPEVVERFWAQQGWTRVPLDVGWSFSTRADLEAVVRIELPTTVAEQVLAEHEGTSVDYAVNLWWRRF